MQWEVSYFNSRGISTGNELWEYSSFSPLKYNCLVKCQKNEICTLETWIVTELLLTD